MSYTPSLVPKGESAGESLTRSRRMLLAAAMAAIILTFLPYTQYILYPIRIFVTFIHESGHAWTTTLTGGKVEYIRINPDGSGITYSAVAPWVQGLVDSGGYLGATLFGALMLQLVRFNRKPAAGRNVLFAMAGYLSLILILWCHNPFLSGLFTPIAGIVIIALLIMAGRYSTPRIAEFIVAFLAIQCSLNALVDLRVLFNLTSSDIGKNDATNMAQAVGLTPTFWAVTWAIMAVIILAISIRTYWKATSQRALGNRVSTL